MTEESNVNENMLADWPGWNPSKEAAAIRNEISKFLDVNLRDAEDNEDLEYKIMSLIDEYAVKTASDAVDSFGAYILGKGAKLFSEEWTP